MKYSDLQIIGQSAAKALDFNSEQSSTTIPVVREYITHLSSVLEKVRFKLNSDKINRLTSQICIYILYNTEGKFYIGSTKNLKGRLRDHYYNFSQGVHRNYLLNKSFIESGDFYFDILEECNVENRFVKEQIWLDIFYGKENCLNISRNALYNKELSLKEKEKLRVSKQRPIICLNLKGEFIKEYDSVSLAAKAINSTTPNIALCCKHTSRSAKGYRFIYKNVYDPLKDYAQTKTIVNRSNQINKVSKPVLQYTLNNEFIKEWSSSTEAAIHYKVHDSTISGCCRGSQRTAKRFIWKFK